MAKGKRKKFGREDKKVVVFNEESRREYLLGFRKRKNERRKKAQEDLHKKAKEKLKEVKADKKKEFLDHLKKHSKELAEALHPNSDVEEEDVNDVRSVNATYDHPEHVVTVTTICDLDLDGGLTTLGSNKGLQDFRHEKESEAHQSLGTEVSKESTQSKPKKYLDSKFHIKGSSKGSFKRPFQQKPGKGKSQHKMHFKKRKKH